MNYASQATLPPDSLHQIVGVSHWTQQIRADISRVAGHDSSVLISGPSGTGKELVARAIHMLSRREAQPYIPVNCAAISEHLFESHMFGHVKGAFTGAHYETTGVFRAAHGGTVFLDEVGELAADLQAKLLRTLQEKAVVPVGSYQPVPVDVRVIAATNRDLDAEVATNRFREDLFYRLNVVSLATWPLKDRPDDIQVLAEHCLSRLADDNGMPLLSLTPDALAWMLSYDWPGNVRQLENALERAMIFAPGSSIDATLLRQAVEGPTAQGELQAAVSAGPPTTVPGSTAAARSPEPHQEKSPSGPRETGPAAPPPAAWWCVNAAADNVWPKLEELEEFLIRQTLEKTFYNQTAAAQLLGITFRILSRKIKQYGIDTSRSRRGRPRKTVQVS